MRTSMMRGFTITGSISEEDVEAADDVYLVVHEALRAHFHVEDLEVEIDFRDPGEPDDPDAFREEE